VSANDFWVAMMKTPDDKLMRADPVKLAAKYSIPETWARFWLATWLGRTP
jgi:hypothetical protein